MDSPAGLDLVHSFLVVADELELPPQRRAPAPRPVGAHPAHPEARADGRLPAAGAHHPRGDADRRRPALLTRTMSSCCSATPKSVATARGISEGRTGTVRVAYMAFAATELMPRTVARFGQLHPQIEVKLRYIRTQGQKLALANDEIDIGYMIGPFIHTEYHTVLLASDPLYLVGPRNHALMRQPSVRPADLAGADLILGDMAEWGEFRWRLADIFHTQRHPVAGSPRSVEHPRPDRSRRGRARRDDLSREPRSASSVATSRSARSSIPTSAARPCSSGNAPTAPARPVASSKWPQTCRPPCRV